MEQGSRPQATEPTGQGLLFHPPTPRHPAAAGATTPNRFTSRAHPVAKFADVLKLSKANMVIAQQVYDVSGHLFSFTALCHLPIEPDSKGGHRLC